MASLRVKIYLPQDYFAIRGVRYRRWQIKLTGFSSRITMTTIFDYRLFLGFLHTHITEQ